MERATEDDRVVGLHVEFDRHSIASFSQLQEMKAAIEKFKAKGKKTTAFACT